MKRSNSAPWIIGVAMWAVFCCYGMASAQAGHWLLGRGVLVCHVAAGHTLPNCDRRY